MKIEDGESRATLDNIDGRELLHKAARYAVANGRPRNWFLKWSKIAWYEANREHTQTIKPKEPLKHNRIENDANSPK